MIEVQWTAYDRLGQALFFAMGVGVTYRAALSQALTNAHGRMRGDKRLADAYRTYRVERV